MAWLGEWGIKHLPRSEARGDSVSSLMYWARFATYAMKVGFLLVRQFAPYHKWLAKEFSSLPEIGSYCTPLIEEGFGLSGKRSAAALKIVEYYQVRLREMGFDPVELSSEQQGKQGTPIRYINMQRQFTARSRRRY